jgi:toxin CptA
VLFWFYSSAQADWRIYFAAIAVIASGLAAFVGWKHTVSGQLVWDGQVWRWEGLGYQSGISEQRIPVIADLQRLLLIRVENRAHKSMCMWCERAAFPERWLDFRRAVFSPGRHPGNVHAEAVSGHADTVPMQVKP